LSLLDTHDDEKYTKNKTTAHLRFLARPITAAERACAATVAPNRLRHITIKEINCLQTLAVAELLRSDVARRTFVAAVASLEEIVADDEEKIKIIAIKLVEYSVI
jgi:hypothetical protein